MGQLFGYLFEHQEENWNYWTYCVRKTFNTETIQLFTENFCKGSHGSGYSSNVPYALFQIYFKKSSSLVSGQPLTLLNTQSYLKILYFLYNILLDPTSSSTKASSNYAPSNLTMRSSTEAESQSTSSNTVTPISNEENELPESEEAPPPLT